MTLVGLISRFEKLRKLHFKSLFEAQEGNLLSVQPNLIIDYQSVCLIPSDKIMYFEHRFTKSEIKSINQF